MVQLLRSSAGRVCRFRLLLLCLSVAALSAFAALSEEGAAPTEAVEKVDSTACVGCHEASNHGTQFAEELEHSVHEGLACLDCHTTRDVVPHPEGPIFEAGHEGCRSCHVDADEAYKAHGRERVGENDDLPKCYDCHGSHDVLPSTVKTSRTHPVNLPQTCGKCHENVALTRKYDILFDKPIQIYEASVHGKATKGGIFVAATCNDCHSTGGSSHRILSPRFQESSVNHFNIPNTCGKCHRGIESDFWEGIHGKRVKDGDATSPVCTSCHGEHGIIPTADPRSPVSRNRVAQETCAPCHESAVLNEKYGLPAGRLASFVDSYHGLKSKAGDTRVANCASCHGVHRILPSSDPTSSINKANLQHTCGECHPGISAELASTPIHGVGGGGLRTALADWIEKFYIVLIVVVIGGMVIHWLFDLRKQLKSLLDRRPMIQRMTLGEVWQHTLLMVTFIVLVISGFALRFNEGWIARLFFGWEGGFESRGIVHRAAAVLFILTSLWHLIFLVATHRGKKFLADMIPTWTDLSQVWGKILYDTGFRREAPKFGRFSYVEKAEYWALIWGSVVMVATGLLLWFDNWFIQFLPQGALDIALVVHYWEAWLATLAILVWHMYSTVFGPHVYPMNPSWLTGRMPEEMYKHEHAAHFEEAKRETEEYVAKQIAKLARRNNTQAPLPGGAEK